MHQYTSVFPRHRAKGGHGKKAHRHRCHECRHHRGRSRKEGHRRHHKNGFMNLDREVSKNRKEMLGSWKNDASSVTDLGGEKRPMEDISLRLAVDLSKCVRCGRCEQVCPRGAIKVDKDIFRLDSSLCNGCGRCVDECPQTALFFGKNQEVFMN